MTTTTILVLTLVAAFLLGRSSERIDSCGPATPTAPETPATPTAPETPATPTAPAAPKAKAPWPTVRLVYAGRRFRAAQAPSGDVWVSTTTLLSLPTAAEAPDWLLEKKGAFIGALSGNIVVLSPWAENLFEEEALRVAEPLVAPLSLDLLGDLEHDPDEGESVGQPHRPGRPSRTRRAQERLRDGE